MTTTNLTWYGHDAFKLVGGGVVIYIDPWQLPAGAESANLVLITHDHFDHCAPDDVARISKPGTIVFAPAAAIQKLASAASDLRAVTAGERLELGSVTIETVPAYNLDKFREAGVPFHPTDGGGLGYIITLEGKRYYHTGDSDFIPEMKELGAIDVAMLPVSGTYVMTAEEAAEAADTIRPAVAVPMHYGSIIGTPNDAERFRSRTTVPVEILSRTA